MVQATVRRASSVSCEALSTKSSAECSRTELQTRTNLSGPPSFALRETASGDGRQWYHVLYLLEHQEEDGLSGTDAWVCADYVKAS